MLGSHQPSSIRYKQQFSFFNGPTPVLFLVDVQEEVSENLMFNFFIYEQWKMNQNKKPNVYYNSSRTARS
jgi:hypothetical protein